MPRDSGWWWARRIVGDYAIVDEFNIVFIVINTLVGFTTALFSASYIGHEIETGRLSPSFVRFYHAMFQAMMGSMNVALIANNIGVMWVGLELATLITVVMVGLYRTPQAIEAAWKYFILASVGISLAFFGTILIYLAGQPALGEGVPAMTWSLLQAAAARMDPAILDLAFIFLLIGYGTKVGLAPLHAWLPDAHAEGPTPISAVLSGLLLNVALYALLRFKMLVAGQPAALDPGPVMVVMGLVSLIFAAFMLYQRRDIKRLFAYSSIEHMGLIVFAFGMGGPLANFAGLLHMAMHSLTKSGIFFAVGHIAQAKGTQRIADITGLSVTHPRLAVVFALAVLAICRPAAVRRVHQRVPDPDHDLRPRAVACPAAGVRPADRLRRAVAAPAGHDVRRARGTGPSRRGLVRADGAASAAGARRRHLPAAGAGRLVPARRGAARMSICTPPCRSRRRPCRRARWLCPACRRRRRLDGPGRRAAPAGLHDLCALVGGWRRDAHGAQRQRRGACAPSSRCRPSAAAILRSPPITRRRCASSAPCAISMAFSRSACPIRGPGSITAAGPGGRARRATNSCRPRARACTRYPVGPVHAGIIEPGHFRFTANGETVVRLEERLGYVHKGVEGLMAGAEIEQAARIVGRISGDSTVAYAWAFARAVEAALGWTPPPRAVLLRGVMAELERLSHHINDVGAICNDASVLTIHARCTLQREDVLAVADACFGHRLMMDRVVPGGVAADLSAEGVGRIRGLLARFEETRAEILRVYDSMPSLQDRTVTTGIVSPELVRQYAAGGFVGRASGRAFDARKTFAYAPYDRLDFDLKVRTAGDVDARLLVRMDEIGESLRMLSPAPRPAGAGRDPEPTGRPRRPAKARPWSRPSAAMSS